MMLHRPSLVFNLYLLGTVSSSHASEPEQKYGTAKSSLEVQSVAPQPPESCGGIPGRSQSAVFADQGDLLLMTSVSQVRRPQDAANANKEISSMAAHVQPASSTASSTVVPMLSRQTIASGITPDGELALLDSTTHTQPTLHSSSGADSKEEALVQTWHVDTQKGEKPMWSCSKQIVELLQTMLHQRSRSFMEGVMLFILCNVFLCALVIGICFLWNSRGSDEEKLSWPDSDKAAGKQRTVDNRGIGALEERRSQALGQKQAPSARSLNGAQREARTPRDSSLNTPSGTSRQLCPELVVPLGSECILAVRCLVTSQTQQCEFDVLDINGKAVLKVEVTPQSALPRGSHGAPQKSPTITLKALQPREITGGMVLAYCCSHFRADDAWNGSAGKRNVCIYSESDELFAHIVKDEARHRYVLTSGRPGLQLLFEGNFEERAVDVANDSRELLAATEPCAMPFDPMHKYYKLRVAADVDVGLVLCGLLAIDQIEIK